MTLPLGLFALFIAPEFYNPLRQFAANYHDRAAARAAVGQLGALFDGLPDFKHGSGHDVGQGSDHHLGYDPADRCKPGNDTDGAACAAAVCIDGLSVHAAGRGGAILRNVSVHIANNEHVALMGASGSGKTTLLETMVGLRPLSSGQVRVLGRRVFAGSNPALGSKIVLLGQQPFFLPVSLAGNRRLSNPAASRGALEQETGKRA